MSKEFTEAAASYFGIDPARLADSTLTSNAEGLTLHLKIRLTDDDMIATGKRMEERRKKPDPFLRGRSTAEDASHMHFKDDTGTWHYGPASVFNAEMAAQGPLPVKGHP